MPGYAETFQIPVVSGRNFNMDLSAAEEKSIMLNQTAAKAFGWTNPVGKQLKSSGGNDVYTVVGVLNDFHYEDLQQPLAHCCMDIAENQTSTIIPECSH
jgi:putative ABC transport system permease protein